MLITNSTKFKLRFSIRQDISMDEVREAFAYVIADGCSLNIPENEHYSVSIEEEK